MKAIVLSLFFLPMTLVATAASVPDSAKIPCVSIQHVVQDMGAVVLSTGGSVYDRLVRDTSFCSPRQISEPAFVTALDDENCPAGLRCREID